MVCDEDRIDYLVNFYSKSNRLSISIFTVIVIDLVAKPYKKNKPKPRLVVSHRLGTPPPLSPLPSRIAL